jgi:hypothetical protein
MGRPRENERYVRSVDFGSKGPICHHYNAGASPKDHFCLQFPVFYPRVSAPFAVTFEGIEWQKMPGQKMFAIWMLAIIFLLHIFCHSWTVIAAHGRATMLAIFLQVPPAASLQSQDFAFLPAFRRSTIRRDWQNLVGRQRRHGRCSLTNRRHSFET